MQRRIWLGAGLLAAATLTAAVWYDTRPSQRAQHAPLPMPKQTRPVLIQTEPMPIAKQMEGKKGIIQMTITDKGFQPAAITSPRDGPVRIHLKNAGSKPHNFVVPRFRIYTSNIPPGGENYVEFTANDHGTWDFFSGTAEAPESGLSGQLKVE